MSEKWLITDMLTNKEQKLFYPPSQYSKAFIRGWEARVKGDSKNPYKKKNKTT